MMRIAMKITKTMMKTMVVVMENKHFCYYISWLRAWGTHNDDDDDNEDEHA